MNTQFSLLSQRCQETCSANGHAFNRTKTLALIALAVGIFSLEQGFAQSSSPMSPEKIAAKEKSVSDNAKKRADCKKQAKDEKLSWRKREAFVRDCMARK